VSLQEPERIVYGGLMGPFDLGGDSSIGDRHSAETDFNGEKVRS